MARIKDIIAAMMLAGDNAEEMLRVIASCGQSSQILSKQELEEVLGWATAREAALILRPMAEQNVAYRKIKVAPSIGMHVTLFLEELRKRDELHYPFALMAENTLLFMSVVDFELIMAIVREQQMQGEREPFHPRKAALPREASILPFTSSPE